MIAEGYKIVPVLRDTNIDGSTDLTSIDASGYHRATFVFTFGAGVDTTFTFHSAATTGVRTTAMPFYYARGSAAIGTANQDVLEAWGHVPADGTTDDVEIVCANRLVVCEVDFAGMTSTHKFVTGRVAAASGIVHGVAILVPRYKSHRSPTSA